MEQFSDRKKYYKKKKRTTTVDIIKTVSKRMEADIKASYIGDTKALFKMLSDVLRYPFLYMLCVFFAYQAGLLLNMGMTKEDFYGSYGNVYYLIGNVLFLFIYHIILTGNGRTLWSEFSLFRDFKILVHMTEKGFKARFKRLMKRFRDIRHRKMTARKALLQYVLHFLTGVSCGLLILGVFLLLKDRDAYIRLFEDSGFIWRGGNEYLGILVFSLIVPFIEELIYRVHNMNALRKDVTIITAAVMVTVVYAFFNIGSLFTIMIMPVVLLMNCVYDRTQSARNMSYYMAGHAARKAFVSSGKGDNIISIRDRMKKGRKTRYINKEKTKAMSLNESVDVSVGEDMDVKTQMAEAVNDFNGRQDVEKNHNITDFSMERSIGAKSDITYSFLMNTGLHLTLGSGWYILSHLNGDVSRILSKQILVFQVVVSVLVLYIFARNSLSLGFFKPRDNEWG
ncbi:CPBP family intramembrane glutamic endopeptidase [Oribacterium sp. WCC10]|uniref:CPBP family intramembrane glutamic endopeptidase n=1 Tax=Oribacterium sp. WCC10 TaxID=1855343 RepID=UPI0008E69E8A|nr:CPBP family intramembrane glutamic endopeptidase [Oribacterium sp. WCC10]SFG19068.1 CAAX protease self-immunity [Oribacterium sp. WCC10]